MIRDERRQILHRSQNGYMESDRDHSNHQILRNGVNYLQLDIPITAGPGAILIRTAIDFGVCVTQLDCDVTD